MTVLFSPIGYSDPWKNGYDGAMLHIVRHFKPSHVYLYFTESLKEDIEINNNEWEEIIQSVSKETKVKSISEDIEFPNDFDAYKKSFHKEIKQIHKNHPEETILLNITSGTAQMESTLCLEYVTYPDYKKCIQVSRPDHAKPLQEKNVTVLEQLEQVNSNESNSNSRASEVEIYSFREAMIRNQVKMLIANYDYSAASQLLKDQKGLRYGKVIKKEVDILLNSIQQHEVFPEMKEYNLDETLTKLIFHHQLMDMGIKKGDIANVLIRGKNIAEFVCQLYINTFKDENNNELVITDKDGKPFINKDYSEDFMKEYQKYLKQKYLKYDDKKFEGIFNRYISLPAYEDLMAVLKKFDSSNDKLKEISIIVKTILETNNLRNNVAHNLNGLVLDKHKRRMKIEDLPSNIKDLILLIYSLSNENEIFNYLQNKNNELVEKL